MNRMTLPVLVGVLLLAASCGGDDEEAEPTGEPRQTIEVVATDFAFEPATIEVDEPGVYAFRLANEGESTHALEIEGMGVEVETEDIGPGETAEVAIELEAGSYELYCPVGNHKERGMEGTVSVGGAAAGGGGTTTDDEEGTTTDGDEDSPDY